MITTPLIYEEDDTPKRFREMIKMTTACAAPGPKLAPKRQATDKSKVSSSKLTDDVWVVRPGETFREFNARIKGSGLNLPPGVPATFRAGGADTNTKVNNTQANLNVNTNVNPTQSIKSAKLFSPPNAERKKSHHQVSAHSTKEARGIAKRNKRKELLERKERKRQAHREAHQERISLHVDKTSRRHPRDVVLEPPVGLIPPKAALKVGTK